LAEDSGHRVPKRTGSRPRTTEPHIPRHGARATRTAGQRMRSRLLDAASALFKVRGLNGASITAIAGAADAFPSQVTYYFRTKEALFVEAACRDALHIAERTEKAAARARTPKAYAGALVDGVVGAQLVYAGNIIKSEDDVMATITQIHPNLPPSSVSPIAKMVRRSNPLRISAGRRICHSRR